MAEAKLSERAQKIYQTLSGPTCPPKHEVRRWIRQQTLADELGCSRRSIGRALKELKEASLLVDLNKRHENRCKLYQIKTDPLPILVNQNLPPPKGEGFGEQQLRFYRFTFESNFRDWPDWEKYYPQVTWELRHETNAERLFRQTFDKLYVIRDRFSSSKGL